MFAEFVLILLQLMIAWVGAFWALRTVLRDTRLKRLMFWAALLLPPAIAGAQLYIAATKQSYLSATTFESALDRHRNIQQHAASASIGGSIVKSMRADPLADPTDFAVQLTHFSNRVAVDVIASIWTLRDDELLAAGFPAPPDYLFGVIPYSVNEHLGDWVEQQEEAALWPTYSTASDVSCANDAGVKLNLVQLVACVVQTMIGSDPSFQMTFLACGAIDDEEEKRACYAPAVAENQDAITAEVWRAIQGYNRELVAHYRLQLKPYYAIFGQD